MADNKQVVLVTGAGSGAGQSIAQAFLAQGAAVVAGDLAAPAWPTDAEDRLWRVAFDVSDEAAVARVVKEATEKFGPVNVLVNNAGIALAGPLADFELATWNKVMSVNAAGTFLCTREVVRGLLPQKLPGRIINLASIAGKNGFPESPAYCASKAAVIGFTRSAAAELGPKGFTVNAICPGSIDTAMIQGVIESISAGSGRPQNEVRASMEASIPTGRFQQPQEVAALCVFLASEGAKSINGESINLDGGVVRD
ncbi:SDR family oxidoreductase [Clostridia bacterium OttesenSCG-928-O13]|nr:SDR family oxidoreductase [Clostridia bacterium OttesenSCG-928-O13]